MPGRNHWDAKSRFSILPYPTLIAEVGKFQAPSRQVIHECIRVRGQDAPTVDSTGKIARLRPQARRLSACQ